jgi:hypothetical protein
VLSFWTSGFLEHVFLLAEDGIAREETSHEVALEASVCITPEHASPAEETHVSQPSLVEKAGRMDGYLLNNNAVFQAEMRLALAEKEAGKTAMIHFLGLVSLLWLWSQIWV